MNIGPPRPPHLALFVLLGLGLFALAGCSSLEESGPAEEAGSEYQAPLALDIRLEREQYRPGEMVVARLAIVNRSDSPINLEQPRVYRVARSRSGSGEPANLKFFVSPLGERDVVMRQPVHPDPEKIQYEEAPTLRLAPGESWERTFGFVNLTEFEGEFAIQAHYRSPLLASQGLVPLAVGDPTRFKVEGARRFERRRDGILSQGAAINQALEAYGKPVASAQALLLSNEAGLHDWWVTLNKRSEDLIEGQPAAVAYLINPYSGQLRSEAKPFRIEDRPTEVSPHRSRALQAPGEDAPEPPAE